MTLHNNQYLLSDGVDPLALAEKHGCPLYVYDAAIIKRQYERMVNAFDVPQLRINYACKALSNISVLKYLHHLGACLDTVSIQEAMLGLKAGYPPHEITYTPNCVSLEEMEAAVRLGVNINVDNISMLEQLGHHYPNIPVCIRINPHIMAGGNAKISVGHIDSKFGISIYQMPHVLKVVQATGIRIAGVHMHTGSDILDPEVFLNGAEVLFKTAHQFPNLDYIDLGGGFKVPYQEGAAATNMEDLGPRITKRFQQFCKEYGKELALVFEPGKFLVSEAGILLVKVNVIKTTPSTMFAGVDSGMNHLIRPMLYDAYHYIVNISNPTGIPRVYSVVGYICETDTFGANRKITEIREGDVLAIKNAGAYGMSMASNYNARFRPAEVLVHEGKDYLIRQRETMEDILRNQIEVDVMQATLV
jgi:diaminopimelate decarboxylase